MALCEELTKTNNYYNITQDTIITINFNRTLCSILYFIIDLMHNNFRSEIA